MRFISDKYLHGPVDPNENEFMVTLRFKLNEKEMKLYTEDMEYTYKGLAKLFTMNCKDTLLNLVRGKVIRV